MNNLDWLYTMQPRDLARWFDAEHVEPNDDLSPEKGVSYLDGGSNVAYIAPVSSSSPIETGNQDSREKLERDVRNHIVISITPNKPDDGVLAPVGTVFGWLDRQAAITERECTDCAEGMSAYADSLCDPLKERIAKLERMLEHDRLELVCYENDVDALDALICDMARELRSLNDGGIPTDCMEHERRMRELGIEVKS